MDQRALRQIVSWAYSRRETFWNSGRDQYPTAGWSGRWDSGEDWEYIGFYPHLLKRVLTELGYRPDGVLQGWKERGWVDTAPKRIDKSVRIDGGNPSLIVLRREAIDEIEDS